MIYGCLEMRRSQLTCFFMLSGFVLAQSYGAQIETGKMSFKDFMAKRIIRLYPMYMLGLSLGLVCMFFLTKKGYTDFTNHQLAVSYAYNSLFLPYFNMNSFHYFEREFSSVGSIFPLNGVSWSLFFEMFISLFFIKLVLAPENLLKKMVYIAATLFVANAFLVSFEDYSYGFNADTGWSTLNFSGGFVRVFFGFTAGIFIQKAVVCEGGWKLHYLKDKPALLYALALILISIPYMLSGITQLVSVLLFCPIIVFVGAKTEVKSKTLTQLSKFLGWISYPVYCLHVPMGNFVALVINQGLGHQLDVSGYLFPVVATTLTLVASVIFARFYEEPIRRLLSQQYAVRCKQRHSVAGV